MGHNWRAFEQVEIDAHVSRWPASLNHEAKIFNHCQSVEFCASGEVTRFLDLS